MQLIYIALGTAIGAVLRFLLTTYLNHELKMHRFPWATFSVNMLASFLIGIATSNLENEVLKLLLITGVLGGLSTFSTFINEFLALLKEPNTKKLATIYMLASLVCGLIFVILGLRV